MEAMESIQQQIKDEIDIMLSEGQHLLNYERKLKLVKVRVVEVEEHQANQELLHIE